jgi:peptidoglycan/LPS O-acetylase OafA/YrhL
MSDTATKPVLDLVPPEKLPYMRGIDGLRAIAVMAVLFYHAEFPWAEGGFLGVEVFFVISGYLITSLLLIEWLRTDTIDLKKFWVRRARRLLPAVFLMLSVVSVLSIVIYRDTLNRLLGDVLAASGYVTNWYLIFNDVSYFETFGRPPLLQHLWSLSLEEQFYVLWPLIFSFGFALLRQKNKQSTIRSFLALTIIGIVASTAMMAIFFTPFEDPSRVYYGTDTRAAGILVGVALSLVWNPWRLKTTVSNATKRLLNVVGFGSLAVLIFILGTLNEFSPRLYQGGFLVTSLFTAAVIAVTVHPAASLGAVLEVPVLKWIGTRSYGIYLWHWPIFMITRPGFDVGWGQIPTFVARTALTFGIAELSYRYVESPIRHLGWRGWMGNIRKTVGVKTVRGGTVMAATMVAFVIGIAGGLIWGSLTASVPVVAASPPNDGPESPVVIVSEPTTTTVASVPDPEPTTTVESATTSTLDAPTTTEVRADLPLDTPPPPPPSVTMIGDSVLLGAEGAIAAKLENDLVIDATVSRQFKHADDVAAVLASTGDLGDVVVLHLGTNGAFSGETFDEVMTYLADVDRVIVFNAKVPRRWESNVNGTIASGADRWPDVEIVDWNTIAGSHPEWFNDDLVHLNRTGMVAYADLLNQTING